MIELGVNIDHVATLRQARRTYEPDPVWAAVEAHLGGADGITVHLREDRRHIQDEDVRRLRELVHIKLNLEMAATDAMLAIALKHKPHAACLVPERRAELTTEGGLDVAAAAARLAPFVGRLSQTGIRVSLFIDPEQKQLDAAKAIGAPVVELHTGAYCDADGSQRALELKRIIDAAASAEALGLECHAGHGLGFETVSAIAAIPTIAELNIGHFLIGEAIFGGLDSAIRRMRVLMEQGRAKALGVRTA
jgi:pyridoxine 5-phosphate synthase